MESSAPMLFAVSTIGGFVIGLSVLAYVVLLISLGITSIRHGHWIMFIVGIFLPFFWLIGALMAPTTAAQARRT